MNYGTPITKSISGVTYVAAYDNSAFGAGWSLSNYDELLPISADSIGPAGQLRGYGAGGWAFYAQDTTSGSETTYTSPQGDNGTLVFTSASNSFAYTTPGGDSTTLPPLTRPCAAWSRSLAHIWITFPLTT
jgi:hypothetical protein